MESQVKQPMSEEQLQAQCFQWFWNTYPEHRRMLFHVQQKARNKIEGSRFKAIGVVQGISDLVFITPKRGVIFIELKIDGGSQSKEQMDFEVKLLQRGQLYYIIKSLDQFKKLVLTFLN